MVHRQGAAALAALETPEETEMYARWRMLRPGAPGLADRHPEGTGEERAPGTAVKTVPLQRGLPSLALGHGRQGFFEAFLA